MYNKDGKWFTFFASYNPGMEAWARMGTGTNGHGHEWARARMGMGTNGHGHEWAWA
jgi:hypothetical protein